MPGYLSTSFLTRSGEVVAQYLTGFARLVITGAPPLLAGGTLPHTPPNPQAWPTAVMGSGVYDSRPLPEIETPVICEPDLLNTVHNVSESSLKGSPA